MAYKKILIKGDPLQKEALGSGTIRPGMLIEYVTNDTTVRVHSTNAGNAAAMVAIEDSLQGKEVGDAYTTATRVQYVHLRPGDEFMAYIAAGDFVSALDFLESGGDGGFKSHAADSSTGTLTERSIVARALEAKAGTAAALIKAVCV
jgi:hypothetical protein